MVINSISTHANLNGMSAFKECIIDNVQEHICVGIGRPQTSMVVMVGILNGK